MNDLRDKTIEILLMPAASVESMADEIISLCQPQWISCPKCGEKIINNSDDKDES